MTANSNSNLEIFRIWSTPDWQSSGMPIKLLLQLKMWVSPIVSSSNSLKIKLEKAAPNHKSLKARTLGLLATSVLIQEKPTQG